MQNIPGPESSACVASKTAESECARTSQVARDVQAAPKENVGSNARALALSQFEQRSVSNMNDLALRHWLAVQLRRKNGSGDHDLGFEVKTQRGTGSGAFKSRRAFLVAQQPVSQTERERFQ